MKVTEEQLEAATIAFYDEMYYGRWDDVEFNRQREFLDGMRKALESIDFSTVTVVSDFEMVSVSPEVFDRMVKAAMRAMLPKKKWWETDNLPQVVAAAVGRGKSRSIWALGNDNMYRRNLGTPGLSPKDLSKFAEDGVYILGHDHQWVKHEK